MLYGYICPLQEFRRAWYVLRTGDEHPAWEKLGADYLLGETEAKEEVKQ
jgi:hypothetical protein